jgi:uncharacterized surface protein with fasciclin (FAS1) repeats
MLLAVGCLLLLAVGPSAYAQAAPAKPAKAPAKPAAAATAKHAPAAQAKDVLAAIAANPKLKTLSKALEAAGMTESLKGKGPFTVFAPTDKAFATAYPGKKLDALLKDKDAVRKLLLRQVLAEKLTTAELEKMKEVPCMNGDKLAVGTKRGTLYVGGVKVGGTGVKSDNGVIHVVSKFATLPKPKPARAKAPAKAAPKKGLLG